MEKYKPIWDSNKNYVTYVKISALYDGSLILKTRNIFLDNVGVGSRLQNSTARSRPDWRYIVA